MAFTFDPNKQAASFSTIGFAGKYNVEIIGAEYGTAKNTGNEKFTLEYKVLDGTEMGNTIPFDTFTDDSRDTGKKYYAFQRINSLLAALGVQAGYTFELRNASQMVGMKLSVTVDWRENTYNGKTTWVTDVKSYGPLLEGGSVVNTDKPRPANPDNNSGAAGGFGGGASAFGNNGGGTSAFGGGTGAFGAPTQQPAAGTNAFGGQPANQGFGGQPADGGFGGGQAEMPAPTDNDQPPAPANFGAQATNNDAFGGMSGTSAFGNGGGFPQN